VAATHSRKDQAEATRAALIDAARHLFVQKGYHATGTEEIVAAAGVGTRGALYHHFADKQALFLAVFEAVEEDLLASAGSAAMPDDAFGRLRTGLLGFLEASTTPEVQQVLLIDGPAVLGWEAWRSVEEQYGLGAIEALLAEAVVEGTIRDRPLSALSHMLLAAVDEGALYIAGSKDPAKARAEASASLDALLAGIRNDRRPPPPERSRRSRKQS
jgi:AcrR family transcriptional regulator